MRVSVIFLFFIISGGLRAQQSFEDSVRNLHDVNIIGLRVKTLPGSGDYIDAKQLSRLNQTDINKVLRTVPGVNIRDEEGFGLRPNIGLRGTAVNRSAKITLMEDGILMAPAPYADPSAYYFPTFSRMAGVEVLKGSSQIKYGPYTIGGAVNLLSTHIPDTFQGFAQASYGSYGTNQQRVWVGDSRTNVDYVFEINRFASNGFKELDNQGKTGFDRRDIMAKLRWHTRSGARIPQSVTFKFVNTTEEANESYLGLTFSDFKSSPLRRYAATQKDRLDLKHHHVSLNHMILPARNLKISTTGYYASSFRDWARINNADGVSLNTILNDPSSNPVAYKVMTGQANGSILFNSAARAYTVRGVQSNLNYFYKSGNFNHNLQGGVRYHEDEADRYATESMYQMSDGNMILSDPGILGNRENQIRKASSLAAYFQYDVSFGKLTLTPGVRFEHIRLGLENYGNDDYGRRGYNLKSGSNELSVWLPGVGVSYAIQPAMHIFGGIHKGFSPPGMPAPGSADQANPETAISYELGYRLEQKGFRMQVAGFVNAYDNILGSDNISSGGLGSTNVYNAGRARILGAEASVSYDLLSAGEQTGLKMPLSFAYTLTNARFLETFKNAGGDWGSGLIHQGDRIPFITPQLLTAAVGLENERFDLTLTSRYVGKTRVQPGQGGLLFPTQTTPATEVNAIDHYWIVDISGNYNLSRNFTLYTLVNNVTNSRAIVANLPQGYRPAMPFAFNLGVKARF